MEKAFKRVAVSTERTLGSFGGSFKVYVFVNLVSVLVGNHLRQDFAVKKLIEEKIKIDVKIAIEENLRLLDDKIDILGCSVVPTMRLGFVN